MELITIVLILGATALFGGKIAYDNIKEGKVRERVRKELTNLSYLEKKAALQLSNSDLGKLVKEKAGKYIPMSDEALGEIVREKTVSDRTKKLELEAKNHTKAIELEPDNAEYYSNRGNAYYNKGIDKLRKYKNYQQSIKDYKKR